MLEALHAYTGMMLFAAGCITLSGRFNALIDYALRGTEQFRRQNGEAVSFVFLAVSLDMIAVPFGIDTVPHYIAITFAALSATIFNWILLRRIRFTFHNFGESNHA